MIQKWFRWLVERIYTPSKMELGWALHILQEKGTDGAAADYVSASAQTWSGGEYGAKTWFTMLVLKELERLGHCEYRSGHGRYYVTEAGREVSTSQWPNKAEKTLSDRYKADKWELK